MIPPNPRKDYPLHGLSEADLAADPIAQFRAWFDQAAAAGLREPKRHDPRQRLA